MGLEQRLAKLEQAQPKKEGRVLLRYLNDSMQRGEWWRVAKTGERVDEPRPEDICFTLEYVKDWRQTDRPAPTGYGAETA